MKQLLDLIGQPGAGKSTLLAEATKGLVATRVKLPLLHLVYQGRGIQLGTTRAVFNGTDALPMNVQPLATAWLTHPAFPYPVVIAEGDRLANGKFFTALREAGWDLTVVLLDVPLEIAEQRRAERGSSQDATWLKGRVTKVDRLAYDWVKPEDQLDGTKPVAVLAAELRQYPAFQELLRTR